MPSKHFPNSVESLSNEGLITRSELRILLEKVTQWNTSTLLAHPQRLLSLEQVDEYRDLLNRRVAGEPMSYILGKREFYSRSFKVNNSVLIPRPETEELVSHALEYLQNINAPYILDLGTGSGVIGITLCLEKPDLRALGIDCSPSALRVALHNARSWQVDHRCQWVCSDWLRSLNVTITRFHAIVANPPYIALNDIHLRQGDLCYEPPNALVSGDNGLEAIKQIIPQSNLYLRCGGCLFLEHGYNQGPACRALLHASGFSDVATHTDLAGKERVSRGKKT